MAELTHLFLDLENVVIYTFQIHLYNNANLCLSVCFSVRLSVCVSEHQHFRLITVLFVDRSHPTNFFRKPWAMDNLNLCLDFDLNHGKRLKKWNTQMSTNTQCLSVCFSVRLSVCVSEHISFSTIHFSRTVETLEN